ncbi:hypothetical protein PR202_ga25928 [Eleusine coracana subsp. coracana]|uniref:Peptidase A1 domain-containing protein n=1 Tax=Eleusine coracana subsp. coracana TaxID=191504 RepID=A0AAV5DCA3_ELECO|nr:hypothetical protein PR202_ga25928 [Eleusine coracana subsp. coracana]
MKQLQQIGLLVHSFEMILLLQLLALTIPCSDAAALKLHATHVDAGRGLTRCALLQRMAVRTKARAARLLSSGRAASDRVDPGPYTNGVPDTEYLVHLAVGTPPQPVQLILDTGSDLVWTHSITTGQLAADNFTFAAAADGTGRASVPGLAFGWGLFNNGIFESNETGIAGFSRGALSLPSQLKVDNFSHCFTAISGSEPSSTVLLGLPADLYSNAGGGVQSTPLIQISSSSLDSYYLSLKGITVGSTRLAIPESVFVLKEDGSGGTVIDSGTGMTSLPQNAYDIVSFVAQVGLPVLNSTASSLTQLCFMVLVPRGAKPDVPKLVFHFEGAALDLPRENYIIGNYQQQNMHVVYDLAGNMLSFVPAQCSEL